MSARPLSMPAAAKINLSLVVGPARPDGYHEISTVMQRIDLCDRLRIRPGTRLAIEGFSGDTLVRRALELLADKAGVASAFQVTLEKRIPLAGGLGGGSADAAAALSLANALLAEPLAEAVLHELACTLGSDVPFFLEPGPKLAEGRGELLTPLEIPQDYVVLVALERGVVKRSTQAVYEAFDRLELADGFEERRLRLREAVRRCRCAADLEHLPGNDLRAALPPTDLPERLRDAGAFRADLSGAGPSVYGLFDDRRAARAAARALPVGTRTWVVAAVW